MTRVLVLGISDLFFLIAKFILSNRNQEQTVMERIIYALAFWYSVDYDLQHISHPHVHLRIAGIIITRVSSSGVSSSSCDNGFVTQQLIDDFPFALATFTESQSIAVHE